jgi:penicillin-binding protein 1A
LGALGLALAGLLAIVGVFWHFSRDLPSVAELESGYAPPQVTRILARDGTLLANLFTERRTVVPFERVPSHVKHAFLAAEDAHFYQHEGLNYLGIVRAMWVNLRSGRVSQGGSTITQQVVKNVLLDSERSYRRKIRETLLAHRLEQHLTKEQILGLYLNHIYLGHGRWGVEEAAVYYFGKHVEELDIAEGALLAGIVASPERFTPRRNEEKALERRRYVLGQMRDKGFMTEAVHAAVVEQPIRLALAVEAESDLAPEIVPHVKKLLGELAGEEARRGGFTVHTTIDPHLQAAARRALRDNLDGYLRRQKLKPPFTLEKRKLWGEVFTGRPRRHAIYTGQVVALDDERHTVDIRVGDVVGRVDLRKEERFNPQHLKPSEFVAEGAALRVRLLEDPASAQENDPVQLRLELGPQGALVAVDVRTREVLAAVGSYEALMGGLDRTVQARRQPGSSFKPFVYSYALHARRVTPATVFRFERAGRPQRGDDAAREGEEAEVDVLTLRQGVARSDNRVAQQVLSEVGAGNVVDWAHALGIESKLGATPSLALGAYEVTPLEIANAYATLSAGGQVASPRFITKVVGPGGELVLPEPPPARPVVSPDVAYLMTSLLESVVKDGTAARAKSLGFPVAGKTGTTNQAKDAWFVGYSTDLAVASWVGFDDALPLGWGEAGAVTALPAWIDFMKAAHAGKPAAEFPRPPGIVEQRIDPATGMLAPFDQEDALVELFLDGTAPTEVAPPADTLEEAGEEPPAPPPGLPGALPEVPPPPVAQEQRQEREFDEEPPPF